MIKRPQYINTLLAMKDKDFIKVLTGVRRCGKSTILQAFVEELIRQGISSDQVQVYNFEDLDNAYLQDYQALHKQISDKLVAGKMNYVFLDEIQMVDQFEKALNSLFLKDNLDLYITGSNAYMLSGELATLLSGRYVEIKVLPLSFAEYSSRVPQPAAATVFQEYLDRGGFPYAIQIDDDRTHKSYIDGIVNTVFVKDILSRKKQSDAALVEQLARYLTDTSGSRISVKKIADSLTSSGQKTTSPTISEYLKAFSEAYLFYRCDRFDVFGKKYLSTNAKYYPVDQSLRRALLGRKRPDFGHRLEGIVYLELIRRGYQVYVADAGELEIDFVAQKEGVREYFQVAYSVVDKKTYQREVAPFFQIKDNYRKILLTMDEGSYNDQGIEQINIVDWLLETSFP